MNNRYEELDTVRGLAAVTVVNWHFILMIFLTRPRVFYLTPIYFFVSGSEAVLLFFILSGFVLALPFLKDNYQFSYPPFIIKRIFRIYLPYLIAIIFTFILSSLFDISKVTDLSTWFENKWSIDLNPSIVIEHLILIGNFQTTDFNPVIWSLIHELRISLIFPLIMILIIKYNWKINLAVGLVLSGISQLNILLNFQPSLGYHTSYFDTLHYLLLFIIGALLAKQKDFLINYFKSLNKTYKLILLIIGFLLYTYSRFIPNVGKRLGISEPQYYLNNFVDISVSLGAVIFIIAIMASGTVKKVFSNRILVLNGRISYSLYLYHVPVMFIVIYSLKGLIPNLLVFILAFIITYIVSYLSYKYIEIPSISIGRKISKKRLLIGKREFPVKN